MGRRTVTTPGGEVWHVRRLWAPRLQGERLWSRFRRRTTGVRRRTRDLADGADPGCLPDLFDDALAVIGLVIAAVVVVAFLLLVGFPLLFALFDVVVIALLTLLGIVARVVFRRPWVVEATGEDHLRRTWRVVGLRASREAVDAIADALAHGHAPPPGHEVSPRPGVEPLDT